MKKWLTMINANNIWPEHQRGNLNDEVSYKTEFFIQNKENE